MVGNAQVRRYGKHRVSTEYKLWNGLIRNKHNVLHYSDRDMAAFLAPLRLRDLGRKQSNRKLLKTACNFRPDMILLGHCDIIKNKTILSIREKLPSVRIACRNVDPLFVPSNIINIQRRAEVVDHIFLTTGGPNTDPLRTKRAIIHYMPNPCDPAVETFDNSLRDDLPIDLFFCGNSNELTERMKTIKFLKEELGGKINFRTPGYFGEPNVWGHDYDALLNQCKMGLNLNRQEDYQYSSARLAQLMGNGILAFINRKTQLEKIIPEDCASYYETNEELLDQIIFFVRNNDQRKATAAKGRAHYLKHFSSDAISSFIVESTFDKTNRKQRIWEL